MTTQEQILEAQAKLKELEAQREKELRFPIYTKFKGLELYARIEGRNKSFNVFNTDMPCAQATHFTVTNCSDWNNYIKGESEIVTREEFEAARTEALKKLAEI